MFFFTTLLNLFLVFHSGNSEVAGNRHILLLQQGELTKDILLGEDPDFECPGYGAWPHPERCELYYTCYIDEPTYIWQCRNDYLFDLVYYGCNFPELTDCGDRFRPGQSTDSSTATSPTTIVSTNQPFTCPSSDGVFPIDPDVCLSTYYVCISGLAYIDECGGDLVFDPNLLLCVPTCSVIH